jgi:hypothetical protein
MSNKEKKTPSLPQPSEFGESFSDPVATHGDFHKRPGFRGHNEVLQHDVADDKKAEE